MSDDFDAHVWAMLRITCDRGHVTESICGVEHVDKWVGRRDQWCTEGARHPKVPWRKSDFSGACGAPVSIEYVGETTWGEFRAS